MEDIVAVAADQALQVITQASSSTDSTVSPDSTEKSAVTAAATISSESNKDADAMQVDGDESATKIPVDENKDPETSTSSNAAVVPSVMGNNKPTIIPTIDLVPNTYRRAHKSVIIGNPKLSEFRKILQDKGFNTRFAAGKLLVNGKVVVRKDTKSTTTATSAGGGAGGGSLVIEGVLGSVYYDVRRLLYSQLTVL